MSQGLAGEHSFSFSPFLIRGHLYILKVFSFLLAISLHPPHSVLEDEGVKWLHLKVTEKNKALLAAFYFGGRWKKIF